jgi:energy-coupling factor transporter ATP-binding protein EcfA2
MNGTGLSLENVSFRYPSYGEKQEQSLLEGLHFSLSLGEWGAVFAGADAGKSTLARIIAGLVPRFTGGRLSGSLGFRGIDLAVSKPYELTELVGLVFQDSDEQLLTTRCDTEVAFALESEGVPRAEMTVRVEAALALMGLSDFSSRNPATLSGGEKKRLLLACLAAIDPELWILDEAFEELDQSWKTRIVDHLRGRGKTVLFLDSRWSSQYAANCSRFALLEGGKISPFGPAELAPLAAALEESGLVIPRGLASRECAPVGEKKDGGFSLVIDRLAFHFPAEGAFSIRVEGLTLRKGTVYALVGKNGSGKSTMGKILCGLLAPDSGSIELEEEGRARRRAVPEELKRRVGYMFQNPDYQIFLPTVREELALGLRAAGLPRDELGKKIEQTIRLFRLPAGDAPPTLMSYGARKRLQAATYHLLGRDILILDEIDSGLSYGEFLPLLEALRSSGAGIVVVTHDMDLARAVCQRIIFLEGGRVIREIPATDLDASEAPQGTGR